MPVIDDAACIECGQCERVCPKLVPPSVNNREHPFCYAAQGPDEIRAKSSSGGIFSVVAEYVLNECRGVVCGAAMAKDFTVSHLCVDNEVDLEQLRRSKYVQSDAGLIYQEAEQHLKEGRMVLFSGCPCQVAALRNYLRKSYDNLIAIDIVCHGVPSNRMLKEYMHETFQEPAAERIEFRDKDKSGWRADCCTIYYKDQSYRVFNTPESAYEIGFQHNLSLRECCTDCEFCGETRQGDLTLGDFWHVENEHPEWNDGKGTSIVLSNNEKGDEILQRISGNLILLSKASFAHAARFNRLKTTFPAHSMKQRFLTLYPATKSFNDAIMQSYYGRYDIGLVGHWTTPNFGGQLTCWALYKVLTGMGYSVLMVTAPQNVAFGRSIPEKPVKFKSPVYPDYACGKRYQNLDEMKELNDRCGMFVVASDQLFNNNLQRELGGYQFLDWVYQSRRKVAYAASCGHDYIWGTDYERAFIANFVRKFDAISVREDSAVALFKREFGVDAQWVLDPVWLNPMENYEQLADACADEVPEEPYVFAYILDPDKEKGDVLGDCVEYLGRKIYAMNDAAAIEGISLDTEEFHNDRIEMLTGSTVNEWLAYIRGCEFMITDSFHGMCFAILFRKPFVAIANRLRGLTRFTSILGLLHLEDRLVFSLKDLADNMGRLLTPVDYEPVYEILRREQERDKAWLRSAVEGETEGTELKRALSDYDVLNVRCDVMVREYNGRIDQLRRQLQLIMNNLETQLPWICDINQYLAELLRSQNKYIIVISVRDTPGMSLDRMISMQLRKLHLKIDLMGKHWHSYVSVLNGRNLLFEQLSIEDEQVSYIGNVEGVPIKAISASFNKGNFACIDIDNVDYAVNGRGLNIVCIDRHRKLVVDSVCFDTHDDGIPCRRFL